MELKEIIEQLAEVDPKDFADALKKDSLKHFQFIWNGGHKTAMADASDKIKGIEEGVAELEKERDGLKSQIEELGKNKPDVAQLQEKYEKALSDKDTSHDEALAKVTRELDDLKGRLRNSSTDRLLADTVRDLVSSGVDKDYAEVKVNQSRFRDRLKVSDDGSITGALQKDMATPIPLSDGTSLSSILAKELLDEVPPKFREEKRQSGAGIGSESDRGRKYTDADLANLSEEEFLKVVEESDKASREGRTILSAS